MHWDIIMILCIDVLWVILKNPIDFGVIPIQNGQLSVILYFTQKILVSAI